MNASNVILDSVVYTILNAILSYIPANAHMSVTDAVVDSLVAMPLRVMLKVLVAVLDVDQVSLKRIHLVVE
jgi:hypothetical protein